MASTLAPNAWFLAEAICKDRTKATPSSLLDVKGWVAIVTGGGTGLGLLTAVGLAQNGCKVYMAGRRLEVLKDAVARFQPFADGELVPVQCDVSSKEDVRALVADMEGKEKFVNLLVNNHGIFNTRMAFDQTTDGTPQGLRERVFDADSVENWEKAFATNVTSYYFTTFGFLPLLAAAKDHGFSEPGNIVNIGTDLVLYRRAPVQAFAYPSSKAALQQLSGMLAAEFAARGFNIRVNVLMPGDMPTEMGSNIIPEVKTEEDAEWYRTVRGCPFGRPGDAQNHLGALLSLATNTYMTGASLCYDGGSYFSG